MLNLGLFAFAQPWLLLALAGLPVLWLLLRITPPAPRSLIFPAIRLLLGLRPPEETPARTPPWLILLRMVIAALIIFGLAQPILYPARQLAGTGPLVLVIDDGWAAARDWQARMATLEGLLDQAEREARPVVALTTAPSAQPRVAPSQMSAAEARRRLQGLKPKPWATDRAAVLAAVNKLRLPGSAHVVWLTDGLDGGQAFALARSLRRFGRVELLRDLETRLARLVLPPERDGVNLRVRIRRAEATAEEVATILARDADGQLVARVPVTFPVGAHEAQGDIDLPIEMRNRIARLSIEGEHTAGASILLDESWRRRPVGLISAGSLEDAQPLLSELYYLERALEPFAELRRGSIDTLLQRELAVLILPDAAGVRTRDEQEILSGWVRRGGLLLRFAGPRLAESAVPDPAKAEDRLLPVRLRGGDRRLSGVLTWNRPARLAPFDPKSPFAGIDLPDDVVIKRQVLAEPSLDLGEKTWARLTDGSPLVTAARHGEGRIVLVHTTAKTDWSNLPLSGLFVEMLRRVITVSQGVASAEQGKKPLPPVEVMDGFGQLGRPAATTLALEPGDLERGLVEPRHPPGYYGTQEQRRAHNLAAADPPLTPIADLPDRVKIGYYAAGRETDLKPWLLAAALLLSIGDLGIALALRGLLGTALTRGLTRGLTRAAAVALLLAVAPPAGPLFAQAPPPTSADDARALEATLQTRLAYLKTGIPALDELSRAGLTGLTRVLRRRTSIEAGEPLAVDPARDELAFFSLLYWPITTEQADPSEIAVRRLNAFMRNGGTILFDLREPTAGTTIFGRASPGAQALQRLTRDLDIPPLAPVPPDHVLTKSFYLMQEFPGRLSGGALWVEASQARVNDGVTSVLIGSNDWARAWAIDQTGQPLYAVVPGGERQRELAYRFGINLAMYALTGNYKADQVHIPFILERLGQ